MSNPHPELLAPDRKVIPAAPSFLLAGGQRCGSTSLWSMLAGHPRLYFPEDKELHFFDDRDGAYGRGLRWYRDQFAGAAADQQVGEATPEYLYFDAARARIVTDLPDVKIVAILRDPIERSCSQYWFRVFRGQEHLSLSAALDAEEDRLAQSSLSDWERHLFAYQAFSLYAEPLRRWKDAIGPDRLHVLFLEELLAEPEREIGRVLEFLEVPGPATVGRRQVSHRNKISYPRSIAVQRYCQRCIRWGDAGSSLGHRVVRKFARRVRQANLRHRRPRLGAAVLARLRGPFRQDGERLSELLGRSLPWKI